MNREKKENELRPLEVQHPKRMGGKLLLGELSGLQSAGDFVERDTVVVVFLLGDSGA